MKIKPPSKSELNEYYHSYWKFLKEDDLVDALTNEIEISHDLLSKIPLEAEDFRYAEGKWMLKEVVGHLSDAERILTYRALRFSRNDQTPLTSFDENAFVENSNFHSRRLSDILNEWKTVRAATLSLFSGMTDEMLDRKGIANNATQTPRSLLYFILVHERHHISIINERYLSLLKKTSI
jgi:uncharacterized damage-inducible protein DinB